MKASLIIAIYNNIPFLKAILDSLQFQTEKDFEIIITEDGESADVKRFIKSYRFEQTWQHITQKDEGWRKNKALNNAIKTAKTDWLIFIDGDCVLHPRFVEMHLRYANDKYIVAGKRVKLDESTSEKLLTQSSSLLKIQTLLFIKMIFGKGEIKFIEEGFFISPDGFLKFIPQKRSIKLLIGSNMSFSKKAIYSINGFDEDYHLPAVGEDYDIFWRFKMVGLELKSVRNLSVQYHLYHKENWVDQTENTLICRQKQVENKFVCMNGLEKIFLNI